MVAIPFQFNPEYTVERSIKTPSFRFGFGYAQSVTGHPHSTVTLNSVPLTRAQFDTAIALLTDTALTDPYDWRVYTNWPNEPMFTTSIGDGYFQNGDWMSIDLSLGSAIVPIHYGASQLTPRDGSLGPAGYPIADLVSVNYGLGTRVTISKIGLPLTYSSGVTQHVPILQRGVKFKTFGAYKLAWSGVNAATARALDLRLYRLGGCIARWVRPDRATPLYGWCKSWSLTHLNNGFFDVSASIEECRVKAIPIPTSEETGGN